MPWVSDRPLTAAATTQRPPFNSLGVTSGSGANASSRDPGVDSIAGKPLVFYPYAFVFSHIAPVAHHEKA